MYRLYSKVANIIAADERKPSGHSTCNLPTQPTQLLLWLTCTKFSHPVDKASTPHTKSCLVLCTLWKPKASHPTFGTCCFHLRRSCTERSYSTFIGISSHRTVCDAISVHLIPFTAQIIRPQKAHVVQIKREHKSVKVTQSTSVTANVTGTYYQLYSEEKLARHQNCTLLLFET